MPKRSLRNIVMILIGVGLIAFGHTFMPWNMIAGSLLIICALMPHRRLTHSVYAVVGWTALLYLATLDYGNTIWIAGVLSYLLNLLADTLTNRGIRPIPPLDWRLKINLMSTGTATGKIVESGFILLTFAIVFFVFFRHMPIM
ncbi:metal-dependent hydrolase [Paenibacillus cellulosilyticus]|nr:metal-dependent hydrolase [Paenibacillus cellulosilyticus]QKS45649.1 metal-dependent hydrolase [Paenibacillus cellulosilyticus]